MATLFTYGLDQIKFDGTKVGMVYKDTANLTQDDAELTEHFEEGKSTPAISTFQQKTPKLAFSIMNPDAQFLQKHMGGTYTSANKSWEFDGTEIPVEGEWEVVTKKGFDIQIAKGQAMAKINFEMSETGLLLVEFVVTPMDPGDGTKPFKVTEKA